MDYQPKSPEKGIPDILTSVFDIVDVGICITDSRGIFVHANSAFCDMYGYSRSEFIGNSISMVLAGDLLATVTEPCDTVDDARFASHERVVTRKDGSLITVLIGGSRIQLDDGEFYHVSTVTDVTIARRTDEMLRRLGRIFEQSRSEIYVIDAEALRFIGANREAQKNLGYTEEEFRRLSPYEIDSGVDAELFRKLVQPLLDRQSEVVVFEHEHLRRDGSRYPVETRIQYIASEVPPVFVTVTTDLSERRQAARLNRLFARVFDNTREGILVTDGAGKILSINRAVTEITGYEAADLVGSDTAFLDNSFNHPGLYARMWESLRRDSFWTEEMWGVRKNGSTYAQLISVTTVEDVEEATTNYVFNLEDVTEKRQWEERTKRLAYFDPLTDLPNRVNFNERLTNAMSAASESKRRFSILFVNLDRFKVINKAFGQTTGDNLLRKVADRFREIFAHTDTVSHFGGDEFVVLLESVQQESELNLIAEAALVYLDKPYLLNDYEIHVTARIGISTFPDHGTTAEMLLRNAEAALNETARFTGPHFLIFSRGLNARAVERMKVENGLRNAESLGELFLHYQPQVNLMSGKLAGAEVLLRWNCARRGLVPPSEFIPIAEETGLIIPIGDWVLRNACAQLAAWPRDPVLDNLHLAVNLSAIQFARPGLVRKVESIVREAGVDPSRIEIEITESAVMLNIDESIRILEELKALGMTVAVDDFGTGYSSLNYLRRMPIDRLKIDRSFVMGISGNSDRGHPTDTSIVETILALARGLSLEVVAEGVETQVQMEFLRDHGCSIAQGYFYSVPLAPDAFAEYASDSNRLHQSMAGSLR
ncbi:MAG TPA: EAL domain-containing protein [Spirochaetia bacterium]|nr:EAL domain-containing protein [Spirochaetia bacterium]